MTSEKQSEPKIIKEETPKPSFKDEEKKINCVIQEEKSIPPPKPTPVHNSTPPNQNTAEQMKAFQNMVSNYP